MKRGPLSNKEKKFIDDNKPMNAEKIAAKLDRSIATVSKYMEVNSEKPSSTHGLFARKEEMGVTVMTEAASIAGDENKTKRKASTPTRYQGVIHKIKED